jgi:hypothetical protein
MHTRKFPFSVALTIGGMTAANIKGITEIQFSQFAKPEIRAIIVDGQSDGRLTQRCLDSSHPLYKIVWEAIWKRYAVPLRGLAENIGHTEQPPRVYPQQRKCRYPCNPPKTGQSELPAHCGYEEFRDREFRDIFWTGPQGETVNQGQVASGAMGCGAAVHRSG